jgi:DNA-binding LacI/PurR family transcriptional regulator
MKMSEIAKLAEISVATVSRALRSPGLAGPQIRTRIMEIVKQHNYVYNAAAADLSKPHTRLIGVLIPAANKSVFADTLIAVQKKTQEKFFRSLSATPDTIKPLAIKQAGLTVPRDMSPIGFDDVEFAAYCDPPLTTVPVPAREMGYLAVRELLGNIEGPGDGVRQYCLDTDLITRESCSTPHRLSIPATSSGYTGRR